MRDHQQGNDVAGRESVIASVSMSASNNKHFYYDEVLARQADETRTGICPNCHKPVTVLGWVTHSNQTRHIQARCEDCGVKFLAQTPGNIVLADRADQERIRKYGKQSTLFVPEET